MNIEASYSFRGDNLDVFVARESTSKILDRGIGMILNARNLSTRICNSY
jgi:hypothetical protein